MNLGTYKMLNRLQSLGILMEDAFSLRRIAMALQRWHELECGNSDGCIERDEATGKPYWLNSRTGRRSLTRDMESGALIRLGKIMSKYGELAAYVQTDPRGASLYIYRKDALDAGERIDSLYASIGVAVYK